jgi:DNA-binding winged helix-turn-helix (wHTH) protein
VTITFGPFALDAGTRRLTRAGRVVHLTPKAFELLDTLVRDRPNVISKDALQRQLWPETFVDEANLSNLIAEIRHALDDPARAPVFVRTAHRFGYAFCGDAVEHPASATTSREPPRCSLEWDRRRFHLTTGEHIIGRDPDAGICLDHGTVSRRHARLLITQDAAMLEDFASKNGTFRGTERLTAPVRLADGDLIGIGSLRLTFHRNTVLLTTDTHRP